MKLRRTLPLALRIAALVAPLALLPLAVVAGVAYWSLEAVMVADLDPAQMRLRLAELQQWVLVAASATVGLSLIGAGLIARSVANPVSALLDGTRQVARGKFDVRIPVRRRDEVGQLVVGFNAMAASLGAYQRRLVQSETLAALGRVASTVAHEVRNPLNAIRGCVDYLGLKRPDDPIVTHHAGIIADEIERLDSFVGNFLRFARLPAPILAPVEPGPLLAARLALHEASARHRGVAVQARIAPGLPRVRADASQLESIFENLINNAMDAMPGGGTLTVTAAAEPGRLVVTFADSGGGMADAVAERIFDPFFTTKPEGTGLGLTTCRRIAELHEGSLEFRTQLGAGSAFVLSIPALDPAA